MPVERTEDPNIEPISLEEAPAFEIHEDGSVTVAVPEDLLETELDGGPYEHFENLADDTDGPVDEETLKLLGLKVVDEYKADKESRAEWESTFEKGFELLGLKLENGSDPFEGACTATNTLIIENAIKFQSKASPELLPPGGPVKTQVLGTVTPEKEEQAERVRQFMNYQTTEQMPEYFDEMEKLLFSAALVGSAFKKLYYSSGLERPFAEFVPASDFYVPYNASDLRTADRYTHVIYRSPRQLQDDMDNGHYHQIPLLPAAQASPEGMRAKVDTITGLSPSAAHNEQYVLLEQHRYEKFEGDLKHMPYIVTVEESSGTVLALRRNWDEETKQKIEHFVHYPFVRGFGFYGLGYIHLLGNLTLSSTLAMRSLVDAGQFANLPSGFKAKGVRVVGDNDPIPPGEWRDVEASGMDLSKAIIPLPYKEPSQTLYQMMDYMDRKGQKFADSTEAVVADATNYGPVGTTLALLESASKFYNAIHKRFHKAQREEFKILAKLNFTWLPEEYPYDVAGGERSVMKADFDGRIDVVPVSDPNVPTSAHRLTMAQLLLQMSSQAPSGVYNIVEVHKSILRNAGLQNIDRVLNEKVEPQPLDPVGDISAAVAGQPIRAFPGQDHKAHIAVESAWLQDPINGANPVMSGPAQALTAHIKDHMMALYSEQMSGLQQQGMPAQQAAQQILQFNAARPEMDTEREMLDLQKQELGLRRQELGLRAAHEAANIVLKADDQELKKQALELKGAADLAGMAHEAKENQKDRHAKIETEAVKTALATLKDLSAGARKGI